MRLLIAVFTFVLATIFSPAALHAETFDWPGHGKVSLTVPADWVVHVKPTVVDGQPTNKRFDLVVEPKSGPVVSAQFTLIDSPPKEPLKVEQLKGQLEKGIRQSVNGSVEKVFDPKPVVLSQGSGLMVELTDASLVGKPAEPDNYKVMRSALAFLDDHVILIAAIGFNDPSQPDVEKAMSILSSLHFERSAAASQAHTTPREPFIFTTPQSHVTVKVTDPSLHIDNTDPHPNYFHLSRNNPEFNLSIWFQPASPDHGIKWIWQTDSSYLASDGLKPLRVKMLQTGPWNVVAYDLRLPSGTDAHLRAERVQAGTWIVLHIATTSTRPPAKLREELLEALRQVEVVEK